MFKKLIVISLLSMVCLHVKAQQKWFQQQIAERVSINFPTQPRKLNEISYGLKDTSGIVYVSSIVDLLKSTKLDLPTFNEEIEKQEFADDFGIGVSGSFPKYKFGLTKLIMVQGKRAYTMEARSDENKSNLFMLVCFLDGISYTFTCIVPDGKSLKNKDIYLSTVSIK
ncbi:hypothetical protein [Pedobacter rhizosphaerae]|uniref:DUF4251 domain-containing protein n=1 Tax=Pedobacter rhizosphaerae TaxID=390241 RepID=A0A1H9PDJ4_9SPHI|nr:hypothetical protein [Pedobacter rhizosphaerae]SER46231.1 hypothetical protein SAMN04488023_109143 [Pedobacter rhizosphaerae]